MHSCASCRLTAAACTRTRARAARAGNAERLAASMVCRARPAIVLIFGVVGPALALCEGEPVAKDHFSHEHKVYHFNGDDPSVATDELRLWKASDGTQCFSLMTIGPNHHECDISGPA